MSTLTADYAAAEMSDLQALRHFVEDAALSFGASDDLAADVVLAVIEAASNILRHGYEGKPGPISIEITRTGHDLQIRIYDEAPPFDPTTAQPLDPTIPLDMRPAGNMGVHFIRELMDQVFHRSAGIRGNELILIKRGIL